MTSFHTHTTSSIIDTGIAPTPFSSLPTYHLLRTNNPTQYLRYASRGLSFPLTSTCNHTTLYFYTTQQGSCNEQALREKKKGKKETSTPSPPLLPANSRTRIHSQQPYYRLKCRNFVEKPLVAERLSLAKPPPVSPPQLRLGRIPATLLVPALELLAGQILMTRVP